ncbi:helix-turn-helix domain-containing protein [Spirosoma aureum]|uniref:Helix-turn-helix domain-containing protein n=1 Tax=Spirosoma aureum TaxID=2692134 RepID=A0A6G9ATE7_9BACT|nr:ABC transporter permease [Spirosoma aureum]QIP15658.1 helix-turn-helix domain-containing protein [Spirosoma aureum]
MRPDFFHRNLYDLAALGTLFSGLTLALLVGFANRPGQRANLFLSLALGVIVVKTSGLSAAFLPTLGPLLFFYTKHLTRPDCRFQRKDWLHFCPLLVGCWMPVWLVFMSVTLYLYFAHRLIQAFYGRLRPVLMDRPRFAFRGLEKALVLLGWSCLLTLVSESFFLAMAVVLMGMAVEVILKSESPVKLGMPIADRSDARQKGRKLKEAVAANHLYEDAELTLTTLALKLAMHPHELSRIINVGLDKNFSDFINECRVREIVRKMRDPAYDRLTLLGIAYESGFNSKTTFNRVFKEMTGKTPFEYKNSLKKEVPIHELVPPSPIQPLVLRSGSSPTRATDSSIRTIMIRNYLKIAFRNLKRQKVSTSINVIGLAIGLATGILIMLYVQDELAYDRYNEKADQIVRVGLNLQLNGKDIGGSSLGQNAARDLKQEFPEVLKATRIRGWSEFVSYGTTSFRQDNLMLADSSFFDVFTIPFLKGNPKRALTEPNTVVLTEETAHKYFGNQDPVGKILSFGPDKRPYRITGVVQNVPSNSHFQFDMLATLVGRDEKTDGSGWLYSIDYQTYLLLPEHYNYNQLAAKLSRLAEKQMGSDIQKFLKLTPKQFRERGDNFGAFLQPLTDIHLYSRDASSAGGAILYVYVLTAIAAFMLLIACVNFMNLSTATAVRRSREVGVRKVLGSVTGQLQQQFLLESVLLAMIALLVGLLLVGLALPFFNQLTGKSLSFQVLTQPLMVAGLVASTGLVGLLAGSYPAFYLASFTPVLVLKGTSLTRRGSFTLRSGLVVFQFFITISMIIATLTADRQLRYMQAQKLGYNHEHVLVIHDTNMLGTNEGVFRDQLVQSPQVVMGSISGQVPVGRTNLDNTPVRAKKNPDQGVMSRFYYVDPEYIPTLEMRIVEGRNFSKNSPSDASGVILNETAVKALGWQKHPIGQEIIGHTDDNGVHTIYRVVGVVSDFHFESLRQKIGPVVMFLGRNSGNILLKTRANNLPQFLASLKQQWTSFSPVAPFSYSFLDDRFAQVYVAEQKIEQVLTLFSSLTIFIACLGLFGLATYTAEQRTKEIGVRKVLGASVGSVVALLSKDFLKLILIALVLASPIAWWGMTHWLNEFAYKVTLDWWIFALAGLLAVGIALLTVSFQSIKAALMNPVKSLRSD